MAFYYYGLRAVIVTLISVVTSVVVDFLASSACHKKFDWSDASPIMDGLLLALLMPATVPYSVMFISAVFMTAIGKYAFGGNKNLIFHPVAAAYAFCSFTWSNAIIRFPIPEPFGNLPLDSVISDNLAHSFTYNFDNGAVGTFSFLDMLWGKLVGPMGTSNVLIILICGLAMYFFSDISKTVFFTGIATNVLMFVLFPTNATGVEAVAYSFTTGSYMFVLIFMASDGRIAPKEPLAKFIYSLIIGVVAYVLRRYTIIENGAVFSFLIACIFKGELDRLSLALESNYQKLSQRANKKWSEYVSKRKQQADKTSSEVKTEEVQKG